MSAPGTCRYCLRRREVVGIQRKGGGSYRRPPRWYRSSICQRCVEDLLRYAGETTRTVSGYSVSSLRDALAKFQSTTRSAS